MLGLGSEREGLFDNPQVKQTIQDRTRQKRQSLTGKVADLVHSGLRPGSHSPALS